MYKINVSINFFDTLLDHHLISNTSPEAKCAVTFLSGFQTDKNKKSHRLGLMWIII